MHFYQNETRTKEKHFDFGYGINYNYEGMVAHSFVRYYVVTKFILPTIGDLNFSKLNYDNTCAFLDNKSIHNTETKKQMLDLTTLIKKIEPFVNYYKGLIKSYNHTAHTTLK